MIKGEIIENHYRIYTSGISDYGKERSIPFYWLGGGRSNMCNAVFKVKFDNNKFIIKLNVILLF